MIHVDSREVVKRGLAMPHSPRLYKGHLFLIDSGNGTFCTLDPKTGELTVIARLPGYGRGLSIFGDYAFIGLSQAREASTFGNVPLTQGDKALHSGVVAINLRTGKRAAAVHFKQGLPEVFEVLALPVGRARVIGPNMFEEGFGRYYLTPQGLMYGKTKHDE